MKLALIKTNVGCFIGKFDDEPLEAELKRYRYILSDPCMIDFVPVPVQSRIAGQSSIAYIRAIMVWPAATVEVNIGDVVAISIADIDSDLENQYSNAIAEHHKKH